MSSERIASVSVTKGKGENKRQYTRVHSSHRVVTQPCRARSSRKHDEIVTIPPPFSSDVLIEQDWGELLSEEVLHKLFYEFCHGQTTNDRGCCIGNTDIRREGGCR